MATVAAGNSQSITASGSQSVEINLAGGSSGYITVNGTRTDLTTGNRTVRLKDQDVLVIVCYSGIVNYTVSGGSTTAGAGTASTGRPLRVVGLGDSNMFGASGIYTSLVEMVCARASGKLHLVFNAGVSGETAAQIAGRALRDCLGRRADIFILMMGTNDAADSSVFLPIEANTVSTLRSLHPNATVVVCSIYPYTGQEARALAAATAVKNYVAGLNDTKVVYAPTFESLTDGTGGWANGLNVDNLHANYLGTRKAADAVLGAIPGLLASAVAEYPEKYDAAAANRFFPNPTFSVGTPTAGVANGWTLNNSVGWTASIDTSDPTIVGAAQVLTASPGASTTPYYSIPTSSLDATKLVGRRIWVSFKKKDTWATDITPAGYQQDFILMGAIPGTKVGATQNTNIHNVTHDKYHYFRYEYVVTPNTALLFSSQNYQFPVNASSTQSQSFAIAELQWGFCDEQQPAVQYGAQEFGGSKTYDWPSLAAGASQSTTVPVLGAAVGDFAVASMSVSLAGTTLSCEVTATNTVTVTQTNPTGAAVDLVSGNLRVWVKKQF